MATDDTDDDSSSIETQTVTVEIEAEVRLPHDGPSSFDPLADSIATGELESGADLKVRATRVRDQDVLVKFGGGHAAGEPSVFFDVTGLIHGAAEAVESTDGVSLPDGDDDDEEDPHDE
jgi:hypothetical protein